MSDLDAVILVGGQGTRLRPLTVTTPKPLLPAAGFPFLAHLLARLHAGGVDHVVLATSADARVFSDVFGDGSDYALRIDYVTEDTPLGTGGGIRNVSDLLESDDAVICNSDVLSGADVGAIVAAHRARGADVTLQLTEVDDPRAFGLVPTDDTGRVTAFLEKPARDEDVVTHHVNAGCYVFRREVVTSIPADRVVSVERETFPALLASGATLFGYVDSSYWLDIGTPQTFVRGCRDLVTGQAPSPLVASPAGGGLILDGARVAADASVIGGSAIGRGAVVESGASVDGSVLFDDAIVASGARVRDSVVGRGSVVGGDCVLDGAVIGDDVQIGPRNELLHGVRLWPGLRVPEASLRFSTDA